ncbi:MAG: hypothetical protein AAF086_10135, partial [Planctomycetota bacterium]
LPVTPPHLPSVTPMADFDLPSYLDFLPADMLEALDQAYEQLPGVDGLRVAPALRESFAHLDTDASLNFVCAIYESTKQHLHQVLQQRKTDRQFVDAQTAGHVRANADRDIGSAEYQTVIGQQDAAGRVVVGPTDASTEPLHRVEIPAFLQGFHVTLFGPPDTARMSINAMNALHRIPADESPLVAELVEELGQVPRWGADNEDSKTPIMADFLQACENLIGCFERTLTFEHPRTGKQYQLADDGLSLPIKRFPGLALPDGNHLLRGNPLPLHLYDFATHLFHNWHRPEALVFYVPKLENEEEAAYLAHLIAETERQIKALHPAYELGSVKLFIVFENPRAIFRIQAIANALHPWFLGGSLGWHDFLASTARLFKHDPNYRIVVKADPNIVINHIRESHRILVEALAPIGGIAIGGMYGVLSEDGNPASYDVSIAGYIKDVVTQLRRGLDGFWVAHPAFVRPGLALVRAYQRGQEIPGDESLVRLIHDLIADPAERDRVIDFVNRPDAPGLPRDDPRYPRAVLAATMGESNVIANHDPAEVRYNVFQAIQYLASWLAGDGCVALPATMTNANDETVFVRIMDDLATTERSRWELWAELNHGRVSVEAFEQILAEELAFIRAGQETPTKRIAVRCEGDAQRWYPIAEKLLRQLVTDPEPVEFVSELLLPFTLDAVRAADDPWQVAHSWCPGKFQS